MDTTSDTTLGWCLSGKQEENKGGAAVADTKEKIATAQWVLERTLGWIAQAEIKIGIVATVDIAMLGGLAAAFSEAATKTCLIYTSSGLAAIFSTAGIACAAFSLLPRLNGPDQSLLFFGRVANVARTDYVARFKQSSDEDILNDWLDQIHRNAEIAKVKHFWVKKAIGLSFLGAIPWAIAIGLLVTA